MLGRPPSPLAGSGAVRACELAASHRAPPQAPSTVITRENVVQDCALTRSERRRELDMHGATVWFTGLPAAGKSTLAGAVERALIGSGQPSYRLDGDDLRHGLNGDLGFAPADRTENVRRTAHVALLLADAGLVALVSVVSPYEPDRAFARAVHETADLTFLEVFVDTPVELCERRDPKGLYARARRGELANLTGLDGRYDVPQQPDLRIRPGALAQQLGEVLDLLSRRGVRAGRTRPPVAPGTPPSTSTSAADG